MKKGKKGMFFGVSLGVGSPLNVTVMALRVLNQVSCLFVPKSDKKKESQALQRIKSMPVRLEEKMVSELYMPMKKEGLETYWISAKEKISDVLKTGEDVAFAGIGDLLFYGTFFYLERLIKKEGFETAYIPGITSFQALASLIGEPLVQGEEKIIILPDDNLSLDKIKDMDTVVFLKKPSNLELLSSLSKSHILYLGEKIGLRGEKVGEIENVYEDLKDISYFSVIIAKKRSRNG